MDEQLVKALVDRLDDLTRRVQKLENNTAPTIPIYDSTDWPQDAVEGQVVIAPIV